MIKELVVAKNLDDAVRLVEKGYTPYAGGTEISRLNSPITDEAFVSLQNCGLDTIKEEDEYILIGSMCTFTDLIKSPIIPNCLKKALLYNSSLQKRNMATIGGNIAAYRDDSYLIATLTTMHATLSFAGKKEFVGLHDASMFRNEGGFYKKLIIKNIIIPKGEDVSSSRIANTAASHAFVTTSCFVDEDGAMEVALSIKGVGNVLIADSSLSEDDRCVSMWFNGIYHGDHGFDKTKSIDEDIEVFSKMLIHHLPLKDDVLYGSKEYKQYIIAEEIERVVKECVKKLGGKA